ncbi:ferric reduction oxidase 5-like isoform X2 [Solanum pennellii]|uniref:Ferric reduction oxidase 5-like isoform X2 n=1 Tax=Solanum pennellii TaxID=28526 RepID=A0ABM1V5P0_SOLPN|nr:ferric reduction oxidase 5-like isoform X2 [Solanum pennellii]
MGSKTILNGFVFLVFVGWLFIWVMLPTPTYKNSWTPHLLIKLNSTYFREQGINLLLFTFPIMLIAAVSCVYLHLHNKSTSNHRSSNKVQEYFRRPRLVIESLGIVNAVELIFAAMFTVLLIWSLANYIYISYGNLHMHNPAEKVWMAKFRSVALRLGYIGNVCYAFLFFPVTRLSSILPLVGLTSESSIKYHIWLGHLSMALAVLHSVGFVVYYAVSNQMIEMIEWSSTYVSNVAGEIATLVAIAMWVTSLYKIRRKMFDLFFYTHQLYTLYIIFYLLHVGVAYTCMILPGIFLFLIDRYLRFLQSKRSVRLISSRLLSCNTFELTFSKNPALTYNPTSILFVNVPSVSKLQWHPFTIVSSSNLETDKLSVVIKCMGSWSQKLEKQLSSSPDRLQISTEGPYGPSSSHFLRENEIEGKQIQNVEIPTNSPVGNLCGIERELESLPHQSIVQATKVHYGTRPDLKRILFGCKESDVGVVVCGPKSMRHEVANICASGLAQNLHFESISFNW